MGGRKKKKQPKVSPLQVEEPELEKQMVEPVTASILGIVIKSVIGATVAFFTGLFWRWWVRKDKKCNSKENKS